MKKISGLIDNKSKEKEDNMESRIIELVKESQQGNKESFAEIYDQFIEKIYRFIFYKTFNRETAEDLTSQTFLNVLEKITTFNPEKGTFSGWIYTIARNQIIDHYRAQNKEPINLSDLIQSSVNIEAEVILSEEISQVLSLLDKMKEEQREIIILRVWDEMPYNQIAALLNRSEASCKMIFSRTILKLRDELTFAIFIIILFQRSL